MFFNTWTLEMIVIYFYWTSRLTIVDLLFIIIFAILQINIPIPQINSLFK